MRLLFLVALFIAPISMAAEYFDETRDTVTLFSFDEVSIPFTQNLKLEMNSPERHPKNPVVARGSEGSVDSWAVQFYGSVIRDRETGKFRMWYVAVSAAERKAGKEAPSVPWRVAYAESVDGISWEKPHLGLVESGGDTDNNLVRLDPAIGVLNLKVLDEPDDPNPEQRFKMGAHVWYPKNDRRNGTLAPFASADGFTWKLMVDATPERGEFSAADLVVPPAHLEPVGGLYKWEGLYYTSGQNAMPAARPYHGRVSRTHVSPDFVNWSESSAIQAVRTHQHVLLGPGKSRMGEQTHEGIGVWNRGNVLVGISGMWHGTAEWKDLTIDLGFVVSNDGIRFREPIEEWVFLERGKDGAWDQGGLLQGQGFENSGEQTLIYYGAWDPRNWEESPPRGGVGIAVLPRDRFGKLVTDESTRGLGDYQMKETTCSFLTSPVSTRKGDGRLFLNAAGLGEKASLKVELLDPLLQPIAGFSGSDAAVVKESGFQVPVIFAGKEVVDGLPEKIRFKVTFDGEERDKIQFSALYLR